MEEISFSLLKTTVLLSVVGYICYRALLAIRNFRSYAKVFNDCPGLGGNDFHWLYGNLHKVRRRIPFRVVVVLRKRLAEAGSNLGLSVYQPGSTVEKKLTENHSVYNLK